MVAQNVMKLLLKGDPRSAQRIVQEESWIQTLEEKDLKEICIQVLKDNPQQVIFFLFFSIFFLFFFVFCFFFFHFFKQKNF